MIEPNTAHANVALSQMLQESFSREVSLRMQNAALTDRVAELEQQEAARAKDEKPKPTLVESA